MGLRGDVLAPFGKEQIVEIIDMTHFVEAQRPLVTARKWDRLETPSETVFRPRDPDVCARLGIDRVE